MMAARHKSPDMGVNGRCSKSCGYAVGLPLAVNLILRSSPVQEVRNLLWLNFQGAACYKYMAKDAKRFIRMPSA